MLCQMRQGSKHLQESSDLVTVNFTIFCKHETYASIALLTLAITPSFHSFVFFFTLDSVTAQQFRQLYTEVNGDL